MQINPVASYLPPSYGCTDCAPALPRESNNIEAQIGKFAAQAGPGASITVQYTYATGPDGNLYVTGARATTSETVQKDAQGKEISLADQRAAAPGLQDLRGAGLAITPAEEVQLFGNSTEERRVSNVMAQQDTAVRTHEGLHYNSGGGVTAGLPQYTVAQGPDGNYYAVAGQVSIQSGATQDTEKAARQSATIVNASNAPGDASASDLYAANSALQNAARIYEEQANQESFLEIEA